MLTDLKITASQTVTIKVGNTSANTIPFPQNISEVEDGILIAIEAYHVGVLSKVPGPFPVVNQAAFNNTFLTVRNRLTNKDSLFQMPLIDLLRSGNNGIVERFTPIKIDVSKSKLEIADTTTLVLGEYYAFRFIYIPKEQCADWLKTEATPEEAARLQA